MNRQLRVTVWHEFRHEKNSKVVGDLYPDGMHAVMKDAIEEHLGDAVAIRTATLDQDQSHGLSDAVLADTDVLTWWGHAAHHEVKDQIAAKVQQRVLEGMGLIVLHSGHNAKPFKLLMGTGGKLYYRDAGERERLWVTHQGHPITAGLEKDYFELERTEMYGEPFDIPHPDEQVFISWFEGGEVFRSGNIWNCGAGKVFYFRPGHESYPIFYDRTVRRILANAVKYVAPAAEAVPYRTSSPCRETPLEPIAAKHEVDANLH